ncbi:hypothetical protein [Paludibacterium sp.]|uniref:hypothetical protein n=1 Tax=Paludibacterium sp. TaxID=1917523 RepID=UPI0025F8E8CE|nr:hypothetical protein [Paludibacterium sp.]MBV8647840.1 hypothetical protein [Paludibacterium sp.]
MIINARTLASAIRMPAAINTLIHQDHLARTRSGEQVTYKGLNILLHPQQHRRHVQFSRQNSAPTPETTQAAQRLAARAPIRSLSAGSLALQPPSTLPSSSMISNFFTWRAQLNEIAQQRQQARSESGQARCDFLTALLEDEQAARHTAEKLHGFHARLAKAGDAKTQGLGRVPLADATRAQMYRQLARASLPDADLNLHAEMDITKAVLELCKLEIKQAANLSAQQIHAEQQQRIALLPPHCRPVAIQAIKTLAAAYLQASPDPTKAFNKGTVATLAPASLFKAKADADLLLLAHPALKSVASEVLLLWAKDGAAPMKPIPAPRAFAQKRAVTGAAAVN